MVVRTKNFIIIYDESINYIPEIIEFLEAQMFKFMNFFGLRSFKSLKKIVVFNNIEDYKKHLEKYTEYRDYMCADTYDGNINLLSLDEVHKTKVHKNMSIDDLKRTILHEFVHICQKESQVEEYNKAITWFWEALATNLGNPESFSIIEINATIEEIINFNSLPRNYFVAFTIGNYLFEYFSNEEILEYVKYPSKLLVDSKKILNNAIIWSKKRVK